MDKKTGLIENSFCSEEELPLSEWLISHGLPKDLSDFLNTEEQPDTTAVMTDAQIISELTHGEEGEDDAEEEETLNLTADTVSVSVADARSSLKTQSLFFICVKEIMKCFI